MLKKKNKSEIKTVDTKDFLGEGEEIDYSQTEKKNMDCKETVETTFKRITYTKKMNSGDVLTCTFDMNKLSDMSTLMDLSMSFGQTCRDFYLDVVESPEFENYLKKDKNEKN